MVFIVLARDVWNTAVPSTRPRIEGIVQKDAELALITIMVWPYLAMIVKLPTA